MSSKSNVLSQIRALKMEEKPLPEIPDFSNAESMESTFAQLLAANKAKLITLKELENLLEGSDFKKIYSPSKRFAKFSNCSLPKHASEFSDLDLAILEGQIGTAENGAIWLDDSNLDLRAIPFITQHLIIVLEKKNLVENLHQAYDKLENNKSGFGVFIAGPSKTADIEQSLVIGAHGAMSLSVVLL